MGSAHSSGRPVHFSWSKHCVYVTSTHIPSTLSKKKKCACMYSPQNCNGLRKKNPQPAPTTIHSNYNAQKHNCNHIYRTVRVIQTSPQSHNTHSDYKMPCSDRAVYTRVIKILLTQTLTTFLSELHICRE